MSSALGGGLRDPRDPLLELARGRTGSGSARPSAGPPSPPRSPSGGRGSGRPRGPASWPRRPAGTDDLKPCGPSTMTSGIASSSRKRERPLQVLLVEPGRVAELHRDAQPVRLQGRLRLADRVAVLRRGEEPLRVLQEHGAQLPALGERREAVGEQAPHLGEELAGQVLRVQARLRRRASPAGPRGAPSAAASSRWAGR